MSEPAATPPRRISWLVLLPVLIFGGLALVWGISLWRDSAGFDPKDIPSALIGKPAPDVNLPPVQGVSLPAFDGTSLRAGRVTVVNVWASWCVPCRDEAPLLMEIGKRDDFRLVGIDYKDDPANAVAFLSSFGQPFKALAADSDGRAAIDWGVYGVPETYIVDGRGIIRHKIIGPLSPERITAELIPEVQKAQTPLPAAQ